MKTLFWVLAALTCADMVVADACDSVECQNGGTCTVDGGGLAVCECPEGFSGSLCQIPCPPGWTFFGPITDCYYYFSTEQNYDGATQTCQDQGGTIVTVKSQQEQDFIYDLWPKGPEMWIGLNDIETEGVFRWADGEVVEYEHWAEGQPFLGNTVQNCAVIFFDTTWRNVVCSGTSPFFCQIPSHPCYSVECQNGGVCKLDSNDKAECVCPPGITGERCDVDACDGYCKNNGICTLSGDSPRCECPTGFSGEQCTDLEIVDVIPCNDESSCPKGLDCIPVYLPSPRDGHCDLNGIPSNICLPGKCNDCDRKGVCNNKGIRVHCCNKYPDCIP